MAPPSTLLWVMTGLLIGFAPSAIPADSIKGDESKEPCCRRDDTDIAWLHKNADRYYAQFQPKDAAGELQKILRIESRNFEALVKLARAYVDIGDLIPESGSDWRERKAKEYAAAEDFARRAVIVNPRSTWGYFWIAASLGNIAMISPISRQVELAGEIRDEVEKALELDPKNGLAYHVYGVWHRKVAEIGSGNRMLASVLYRRSLPNGTLEKSIEYLKKAVALNPKTIISRLELARSYAAKEEWDLARTLLRSIPALPVQFSDDAKNKQKAEQLLEEIKDR